MNFTHLKNRQQGAEIFRFPDQEHGIVAHAGSNDYLRISARLCLKAMGAGGTTAKPLKPPLIFGFSGALQFMLTEMLMDYSRRFLHLFLLLSTKYLLIISAPFLAPSVLSGLYVTRFSRLTNT